MSRRRKLHKPVRTTVAVSLASAAFLVLPSVPAQAATQNVDLWAIQGTTTLPGSTVPVKVWGYSLTNSPVTAPGGPTIEVTQGDTVHVTLHNTLGARTALLFQGQQLPMDRAGADASTGTTEYTFTPSHPGTFVYEAGPVNSTGQGTGTQYQTAMGLHGALVVRPAGGGQAYDADSAYDDEAVLVLSEIDPALNNASDPALFDMRKYVPRYSLINGKAYPATDPITSSGGHTLLLRYVNAGVNYHSMGVLGASQKIVAMDGSKLDFPRTYVAQTFGPGESADALVKVPGAAAQDTQLSVYDASLGLTNRTATGVGGMLTTVKVPGSGTAGDVSGPVTSKVAFLNGSLTAHVDDRQRGGSNIAAVEYYLDSVGGTSTAMQAGGSPNEDATATFSVPSGEHVLYVRGKDAADNWGPLSSVLVTGADAGGPTTSGPTLSPRLVKHGGGEVKVSATANDSASGNSNISAAEYFVDTLGADGGGVAMTVSQTAPVASVDGTIGQAAVDGLAEGGHAVYIHTQDAQGNWGAPVNATLVVDTTGPVVTDGDALTVSPNPSNGIVPYSNGTSSIRLNATQLTDPLSNAVQSPIAGAEMFVDTVGVAGAGVPLRAVDGSFSDPVEGGYADIPLTTVRALSNGPHTLWVRAKDAAGNWGASAKTVLVVDKVGPTTSNATASPSPTQGARTVTLTATGTDALSSIAAGEFFLGTDPGVGKGTAMAASGSGTVTGALDTSVLPEGAVTVKVRTKDAAGNWGATTNVTVTVTAPLSFSTLRNPSQPEPAEQQRVPLGRVGHGDRSGLHRSGERGRLRRGRPHPRLPVLQRERDAGRDGGQLHGGRRGRGLLQHLDPALHDGLRRVDERARRHRCRQRQRRRGQLRRRQALLLGERHHAPDRSGASRGSEQRHLPVRRHGCHRELHEGGRRLTGAVHDAELRRRRAEVHRRHALLPLLQRDDHRAARSGQRAGRGRGRLQRRAVVGLLRRHRQGPDERQQRHRRVRPALTPTAGRAGAPAGSARPPLRPRTHHDH